jgi:ABC-type molybdenum transport system ATPase subunit/photorepair protein PhrA
MKLTRITRLRHCVFRDFTWPNDLPSFGRCNVICGWNGCGKTTLSSLFALVEKGTPLTEGEIERELDGAKRAVGSTFGTAELGVSAVAPVLETTRVAAPAPP